MEERSVLNELTLTQLKKENVRRSLEQVQTKASELMSFSIQWKDLENHFDSVRSELERRYRKVEAKDKALQAKSLALEKRASKIEAAEADAEQLEMKAEGCRREAEAKQAELSLLRQEVSERKRDFDRYVKDLALVLDTLARYRSQLVWVEGQLGCRKNLLQTWSLKLDAVREQIKSCSLELEFKKREEKSLDNSIRQFCEKLESKSTELGETQKLIDEQVHALAEKLRHNESIEWLIQKNLHDLETKAKRQEEMSQAIRKRSLEIQSKERTLAIAEESIKKLSQKLEARRKEIDQMERSIKNLSRELRSKEHALSFPPSDLQENTTASETAAAPRLQPDPAIVVLEMMQGVTLRANRLEDEAVVKNCLLLLEEFVKGPRQIKPEWRSEALQLAFLWKEKTQTRTPTTTLRTLVFLLFLVGYSLVNLFDRGEILHLAGSVSHCKQAPKLFESLGLSREVPGFVQKLIKREHYVPAARFMCSFKIKGRLSPECLLKMEIEKLRRQSPKDCRKIRTVLEFISEFKFDIDLPGKLVADLMLQKPGASSSSPLVPSQEPGALTSSAQIPIHGPDSNPDTNHGALNNRSWNWIGVKRPRS